MTAPETRQEIEQEIEQTRERLGATVEELAARADVKARARGKAAEVKAGAQARAAAVSGRAKAELTALPGRARRSPLVQRRWPLAVAVGVVAAGAVAALRGCSARPSRRLRSARRPVLMRP